MRAGMGFGMVLLPITVMQMFGPRDYATILGPVMATMPASSVFATPVLKTRAQAAVAIDNVRLHQAARAEVRERVLAEERQRLLLNELNHRVKNTLASVQSLARQSLVNAKDIDTYYKAFEARLMALSQTHNLLTAQNWEGASLFDILAAELRPYSGGRQGGGARFHALAHDGLGHRRACGAGIEQAPDDPAGHQAEHAQQDQEANPHGLRRVLQLGPNGQGGIGSAHQQVGQRCGDQCNQCCKQPACRARGAACVHRRGEAWIGVAFTWPVAVPAWSPPQWHPGSGRCRPSRHRPRRTAGDARWPCPPARGVRRASS